MATITTQTDYPDQLVDEVKTELEFARKMYD